MSYKEISQELQQLWNRLEDEIVKAFDRKAVKQSDGSGRVTFGVGYTLWDGDTLLAIHRHSAVTSGRRSTVASSWAPESAREPRVFALVKIEELGRTEMVEMIDWGVWFTVNDMATILRAIEDLPKPAETLEETACSDT